MSGDDLLFVRFIVFNLFSADSEIFPLFLLDFPVRSSSELLFEFEGENGLRKI